MIFKPSLTAMACLLATPLVAQDVTTATLENGMEVVVIEDHRAPVALHMLWYRTGSADEPPGVSGVAHFLEHLLFKATEDMAAGEFSRVVAEDGGSEGAFTFLDATAYYQRVKVAQLPAMMAMEADRMENLRITEQDVATERQVIVEERASSVEADPFAVAREQMRATLFLNHRYGQPIFGWRHEIEALDRDDVFAFYETYYSPNNAVLIVAGDVEPDAVLALAQEHYGTIPPDPGEGARVRAQEPPQLAARRVTFEDASVSQPQLERVYLAPARKPGDQAQAAALVYLAQILGGSSTTSLLAKRLRFDTDIAVYVSAFYGGTGLDSTTFELTVAPRPGVSLQEAETALDAALAAFLAEGVDERQLLRIRTQIGAQQVYGRDSALSRGLGYGLALTSGLTVGDMDAWPRALDAVTAEDVMAAASDLLDPRRSVTLWISAPQTDAAGVTEGVTE